MEAGTKRYRKKSALKAAGIRIPNSYCALDEAEQPKYVTNQSTQTDPVHVKATQETTKFKINDFKDQARKNAAYANTPPRHQVHDKMRGDFIGSTIASPPTHSTPHQGRLTRRRSLSVGSPPISKVKGGERVHNNSAQRDLFCTRDVDFTKSKEGQKNRQKVGVPQRQKVVNICSDVSMSVTTDPSITSSGGEKYILTQERENDPSFRAPPSLPKPITNVMKKAVDFCQDMAMNESRDRREHEKNKEEQRYHLCPKMNFEYKNGKFIGKDVSMSGSELNITDRSCNSTCICQKHNEESQVENSDELQSEAEKTPHSSYLITSSLEESKSQSQMSKVPETEQNEEEEEESEAQGEDGEEEEEEEDESLNRTRLDKDKDVRPNYYTQAPAVLSSPDASKSRLYTHLKNIRESGGELDSSLLPHNLTSLELSPRSRTIIVRTSSGDGLQDFDNPSDKEEEDEVSPDLFPATVAVDRKRPVDNNESRKEEMASPPKNKKTEASDKGNDNKGNDTEEVHSLVFTQSEYFHTPKPPRPY